MDQNLVVRLAAQGVGAFKAQMATAAASVKDLHVQSAAAAAGQQAAARKAGMAMAAIGVAVVAAVAASAAAAIQLETRMQNVATIWTDASLSISQAGDAIVDMSRELPQSANTLAEGLYDIASSGFQGAEALRVLRAAAQAASAGLTTTDVAARGITAVLNAYGMEAQESAYVSDVLFQTVNLGVVTFEQLSNTMGDFVGTAAVAGVSIADASAAFATMTLSGVGAAEAGTSLNRVLQSLIQPGEELQAMFRQLGVESGQELMDRFGGLQGAVFALNDAVGGNATAIASLFPEMRALRGFLALNAAEGENYARVSEDMADRDKVLGATLEALREQSKSASFQMTVLWNQVKASAIEFGRGLIPAVKLAVGVFSALAAAFDILPGPLKAIVGGAVVLSALIIGLAGAFLLLSPMIAASAAALMAFTGQATAAAAASTALGMAVKVALGPIGWIAAAAGLAVGAFALWAKSKQEAKKRTDELKASLDAATGAITDETAAVIRNRIVKDNLDKKASELGVSIGDLAAAMLGDEAAIARVNAQLDKHVAGLEADMRAADAANTAGVGLTNQQLEASQAFGEGASAADSLRGKIGGATKEVKDARTAWERDIAVKDAVTASTHGLTAATGVAAGAFDQLTNSALTNAEALKGVADALNQAFSPTAALQAMEDSYSDTQSSMTDTLRQEISDRHDAQREANDQAFREEKRRLEESGEARREALDQEHEDRQAALDLRFRAENEALDLEHRARKNALDDDHRARRQALDDVFREERRQLDRRLDLLDEEYDKRRRAEEKAYEAQREEAEFMIRTTWGAERQGWIERLAAIEEGHEAATRVIDRAQDDEVAALKDGQDDSETARKNGLDDQLQAEQEGLGDILAAEKQHLKDRQEAIDQAEADRYDSAKAALADQLKLESDALDERIRVTNDKLDDLKRLEERKADERRGAQKTKHEATLADLTTQLDALNAENEAKLENLKTIWERSGRQLSGAMLTELAALPPGMIAQLAGAGDPAFNAFLTSFGTAVEGVSQTDLAAVLAPFNSEIQTLLGKTAEAGGVGFMTNLAKGLSNDPAGAEKVRQALLALWTSPQGVLVNPQTGLRAALNAEGNVYRNPMVASRPILWAEAGPEAYIPLDMAKARRSIGLLGEVADFYGYGLVPMANGGIVAGGSSGGSVAAQPVSVTIHAHVAADVDVASASRRIRAEVEKGVRVAFDNLGRQVLVKSWRN